MPKLLYSLIAVPKLKKMLKECHLSTQGSREQLVRRHQEFTHIYNAQCDALNPKSGIKSEINNQMSECMVRHSFEGIEKHSRDSMLHVISSDMKINGNYMLWPSLNCWQKRV